MNSRSPSVPAPAEPRIRIVDLCCQAEPIRVPRMLSARTVAHRLDVSLAWVRDWHARGLLKGFILYASPGKGRGRLLFLESDVIAFLEARGICTKSDEGDA